MAGPGAATDRATAPGHHAVFIDTSLDTHLAMIVSDSDTVSDIKVKIALEHPVCFPQSGKVKVEAVKVKRRGRSYHLCDSMLVTNALGGLKKNWFLFVDISKHIEHPESGILGLALTDKPSTDIVVGVADNEQKKSSDLVISASMNATSAILSAGKTDDLGDTNLNAKKRRKRNQASSLMDEPQKKKQISEHMHENSVRVDKEDEPQSFVGALSPIDHATSVAEIPDNPLKQADVEMDFVDASKENNQIAAEFVVNGIVSVVVSEANNSQGKGISISAVHNSADINHHVSKVSESHRNDGLEAPNGLLAEQHINASQDKMESGHGEVKDAGKSLDAIEEKFLPKKRKKSSKSKSTSENPKIPLGGHSLVESPEIPLGDSLVETLKPPHGDASDKPENKEHNISPPQVEGIDVAVEEANVTSHEKQGNEMESSQQIIEKAAATADNVEKKKKKKRNKKKRGTEEKNVQESIERTNEGDNNVPYANEKESEVTAAINKPDENRSVAMPLELREEEPVNADNGEKEKPKRRSKKVKEKNVEQSEGGAEKGEKSSSQVEGNEIGIDAFEKKSSEENVQTEGEEPLEIAGQEQVNQIEPVHEAAELEAAPDKFEHMEKKSRKRKSSKENSSGQSMHVPEKEEDNPSHVEVEERVTMGDGKVSSLEQQVTEKPSNAGDHEEKVEKKSRHRKSSKEKNLVSQEIVSLNSNHNETMPMEKKVEENVEKMEKSRKRRSKVKDVLSQEVKITHESSHKQGSRDSVEEKIEKKIRIKKSSKGVESSHSETLQRESVACADETNDHIFEVPGTEKINFGDYFLPGHAQPASVANSVDEGKNKKSQLDKSRSSIGPDKELSEVTGNGSDAAAVTDFGGVKSSKVVGRSAANGVEVSASSNSSLNRPLNAGKSGKSRSNRDQFRVAIRKLSSNNNTVVGSESKRSLLAGAIFKEDSSGSSKHEAESDHSDSSMRTPSKKLFDYSSSGSDANEDTTDDENLSGEIGRISNGKSGFSGDKSMTLNNILRSSSRYKKAKQAAVESQLNDSESQPVDFVPDSQANN